MTRVQSLEELLERGFRFALALAHDEARAEDLLQDAWVAILKRDAPRHAGYLFQAIRNRFFDQMKRERLVTLEPLDAHGDDRELAFLDQASSWPDVGSVYQALGELRPVEREALFLAAVEGYTVREIVELTGQPLGTVSSLIQRARRKVRKRLGPGPPAPLRDEPRQETAP